MSIILGILLNQQIKKSKTVRVEKLIKVKNESKSES